MQLSQNEPDYFCFFPFFLSRICQIPRLLNADAFCTEPLCKAQFPSVGRRSSQEQEARQRRRRHFIIPDLNNY